MRKIAVCVAIAVLAAALGACSVTEIGQEKLRDLEFTVLGEEKVPPELAKIIEERKREAFKLTYRDEEFLYIVIGYGEQKTGGYSIAVDELYLAEDGIYLAVSLLGPGQGQDPQEAGEREDAPSYPYIVLKTEKLDEAVVFKQ